MLEHMQHYSTKFNLLFLLILQGALNTHGLTADVSLKVLGSGFHRLETIRNLIYKIHFDNYIEGCHGAIHLQLPPAIYVNVDELSNLRRLGISTACSSGETNVELFSVKAQAQNVTICCPLTHTNCTLRVPVHLRYQYASENAEYVNITLPMPKLLLGCKERVREHRVSKLDLCPPCVGVVAKWREIPFNMDTIDAWTVPVGNTTILPVVTCVTFLITILCTAFLMRTIYKSSPAQHLKRE